MKRHLFASIVFVVSAAAFLSMGNPVFGQDATPSETPVSSKQIEDLKDRLATKVAELTETKRMAIHGKVTSITLTTLSVETETKEMKIELTDGIKVFQTIKGKRSKLSPDDIDKGDVVSIFGDYETQLDLMKAKVVIIESEPPDRVTGTVTAVDADGYTITLKTYSGQSYIIDYERSTKAFDWTGTPELVKSGFSKMKQGATLTVLGVAVPNESNRLSALRIVNLGQLGTQGSGSSEKTGTGSAESATPRPSK